MSVRVSTLPSGLRVVTQDMSHLESAAIGVWVAWSDMKFMKIPNPAVLALLAVITLAGCAAKPPAGGDGFYNPGHSSGGGGGV